jgi:seryl-tRNA synthetase
METYQDEGGRIAIPQALHAYLPGLSRIGPAE